MSWVIIFLEPMLPPVSSDLPENRSGKSMVFLPKGILGLASDGVYMATCVTTSTVVSYTAFPPLPIADSVTSFVTLR